MENTGTYTMIPVKTPTRERLKERKRQLSVEYGKDLTYDDLLTLLMERK